MDTIERIRDVEPARRRVLPQHVKIALDHMRANLGETITLSNLASACSVPERTLLRQFEQFAGDSPLAYLRRLRLNTVRSELSRADGRDTISDIATRCGFSHLGRFARGYRQLFGESPSATRRRVNGQAARRTAGNGVASSRYMPGREMPSLLILPLRTETLRESLEARDLTERLAATLSRTSVASVALADQSRSFSTRAPQPRNAGIEYCLLGRLTQCDDRVRVIVRLVDVLADRQVWGDSFDGSSNDPFELQDRVVEGVQCGVVAKIIDAEIDRVSNRDPDDLGARDLAIQALPHILAANVASARKAITILNRAMELESACALPVGLLAWAHAQLGNYYGTALPSATREKAMQLACRAGVLDEGDPLVTVARSATASLSLRWREADALATRALAMDPTCSWAWDRHGYARLNGGDPDRAIVDFARALKLRGPSWPRGNCFVGIASAHAAAGRLEDAALWQRKALAENPASTWMYILDSCYALKTGNRTRVAEAVECMRRAQPEFSVSLITATYPPADTGWLDAIARAGMPLT
jgi:AraC-like DNA-binding protein/TolB-like protein